MSRICTVTGSGLVFTNYCGNGKPRRTLSTSATKETANGDWILLAIREGNVNIWHKLAELWQAMVALDIIRMAVDPSSGLPFLTPTDQVHVVFEDDREEPLDDWWTMITGNAPIRKSQLEPRCYGNVIIPLAGSSSPFWILLIENISHQVCKSTFLLDTFLRRLFRYLRIEQRQQGTDAPVITIIDRQQTRKIFNLRQYTDNLRHKYPNLTINLIDFATLSLRDQVILVQNTGVLIGYHGAGMTHVLFLPEESAVVEILPPVFSTAGFRQLSRMRGLTYFSTHSMWVGDWEKEMNASSGLAAGPAPTDEAGWQQEEWVYIKEEEFQGLVDAALRSQYNRALPEANNN